MKELENAISLAEESVGMGYEAARVELDQLLAKARKYATLWERARTVIATFDALGRTRSVGEQLTLHRRCEDAMVSLKEALDLDGEDE